MRIVSRFKVVQELIELVELTFIIHSRISGSSSLDPNFLERHGSSRMIGDVNLFISPCDIDEEEGTKEGEGRKLKAEMEIMLAEPDARRKGYALETLRAFLEYSSMNLSIQPTNFFARVRSVSPLCSSSCNGQR